MPSEHSEQSWRLRHIFASLYGGPEQCWGPLRGEGVLQVGFFALHVQPLGLQQMSNKQKPKITTAQQKDPIRTDFVLNSGGQCQGVFCLDHFRFESHHCQDLRQHHDSLISNFLLRFWPQGPLAAGLDTRVLLCPLCQKAVKLEPGEDPNITWERCLVSPEVVWHISPNSSGAESGSQFFQETVFVPS